MTIFELTSFLVDSSFRQAENCLSRQKRGKVIGIEVPFAITILCLSHGILTSFRHDQMYLVEL